MSDLLQQRGTSDICVLCGGDAPSFRISHHNLVSHIADLSNIPSRTAQYDALGYTIDDLQPRLLT